MQRCTAAELLNSYDAARVNIGCAKTVHVDLGTRQSVQVGQERLSLH
jgi:hypothetical protein